MLGQSLVPSAIIKKIFGYSLVLGQHPFIAQHFNHKIFNDVFQHILKSLETFFIGN